MNIIEAIKDKNLFRPYLEEPHKAVQLKQWSRWITALRLMYGLDVNAKKHKLINKATGRNDVTAHPYNGALFLVGRRGGKSKISGLIAAYEACLSGRHRFLSKGEKGLVSVISPTKLQSSIIYNYIQSALDTDLLRKQIVKKEREFFELANGVRIMVLAGDWRSVRGFTQLAVIVDEVCFFGLSEESKVKSDTELIRAVRPALATTYGKLIAISTKYAERGWAYNVWKRNKQKPSDTMLVWEADSLTMNPTLDKQIIQDAIDEDPASAKAEFLNQWRSDVCEWLPRSVIEKCVVSGRVELLPNRQIVYHAFCDVSGGRNDPAALGIGHINGQQITVDFLKEYKAPNNPADVIGMMSEQLKRYRLKTVFGDGYAAQFVVDQFKRNGISYKKTSKNKSELYLILLGRICSGQVQLLDNDICVNQLAGLERKTRSGGRDVVDHRPGAHDDVSNVVAGLCYHSSDKRLCVGSF